VYGSKLQYGEDLVICTLAGKAVVPRKAQGFVELRNFLMELVPQNDPDFVADDPRMFYLYTLISLIGIFVGAWLAPAQSSWLTLFGAMLLGALLSAAASYGLVLQVGRLLRK
jgi:hypothetical protein